jgi:hypothetical protein
MKLYRAHSSKYLSHASGTFENPNLARERRPRDTSIALHAAMGRWFNQKFGIDYRSKALFCTGSRKIASGYIDAHKFLIEVAPIGDYSLCFTSGCMDLFGHFQFAGRSDPENINNVDHELDILQFVEKKNDGLTEAAQSGCEVMLFAHKFSYFRLT